MQGSVIDILVDFLHESRSANGKEDQIPVTDVGDSLTAECWNEHHIAWVNFLGRESTDLHGATALDDDVAFCGVSESVPSSGYARRQACSGDGCIRVIRSVGQFDDETSLGGVELIVELEQPYCFVHRNLRLLEIRL